MRKTRDWSSFSFSFRVKLKVRCVFEELWLRINSLFEQIKMDFFVSVKKLKVL